jgi:hypothetical protein
MKDIKGYRHIPRVLFVIITFLVGALPIRSVPTFIELLFGAMLSQAGFVARAWMAVSMHRHWTSYYKWLQKGKWSWVALGLQMARLLRSFFPSKCNLIVIDDTIILRASKKAPDSKIHHQHGNKPNRPRYVRGQCWVSLAQVVEKGLTKAAIPLLSRMMRADGNTSKLDAAKVLIRAIAPVFADQKTCLLLDSWYMRGCLIAYAAKHNIRVIGQVRKDTALYDVPIPTGKRGRPRKYGDKYTPERVVQLPEKRARMFLYGKKQWLFYKSVVAKARFLNGTKVRAVWTCFENEDRSRMKPRLILSTDLSLTPQQIIATFSRRWAIETMFAQLKNNWGWKEAWQQTRQVLHRWTQILSIGYAIPQLMALKGCHQIATLTDLTPWRRKKVLTAGQVRIGLQRILSHVNIRAWWNPKSRKFEPPDMSESPKYRDRAPFM